MYYGVDYYPEHWPRERWDTDARLMQEAGINLVRMGEFAWALMEPSPGHYDFRWLDEAIELLARHDIDTVLGTPTAAPPAWLCHAYPEVLRVTRERQQVTFGMRRQYCPGNETYRRLSTEITAALAEHYAGHERVIGWQIDNEFGCHDSARCYCPQCQRRFQRWLAARYGTLDALNEAWGTVFWSHVYTAWEQIPLPWSTSGVSNPSLELDFYRFSSDQVVEYQAAQIAVLRERCPEATITTNLMGFGFQDINYFDLARPLDVVSWDNYPLYSDNAPADTALSHVTMRGLKDRPFWVMEQQAGPAGWQTMRGTPRPGQLRLWAYQALAHGADALVYFRWRTCPFSTELYWHGVLDHDGVPRRRYREVAQMGGELARVGDMIRGTLPPKEAALILSYDDGYALRLQPGVEGLSYAELFRRFYRALYQLRLSVDIVPPDADLSPYRLVIAPTLHLVQDAWVQNLEEYVRQGGVLVLGPRSGVKGIHNRVTTEALPGLLRDLCGVNVVERVVLGSREDNAVSFGHAVDDLRDAVCAVYLWCEVLAPFDAETLARYTDDYYAGEPAITWREVEGGGGVVYVGALGNDGLFATLATWLVHRLGLSSPFAAPGGVEVTWRARDGVRLLFVLNHNDTEQLVKIPYRSRDLISGRILDSWATIEPYGVYLLTAE